MKNFYFLTTLFVLVSFHNVFSQNILNGSSFPETGWVYGFWPYGNYTTENSRVLGSNHIGEDVVLWMGSPDGSNNADGGFTTILYDVDPNKTYRFTVWIKKTNSNDGSIGFGCGTNTGGSEYVADLSGNQVQSAYFFEGDLPILNRWYFLVGFVHPTNYNSVSQGRIYDGVTGEVVQELEDFKFQNGTVELSHKAVINNDTNTSDRGYFFAPRMEVVNGNEYSIDQLMSIHNGSGLTFTFDLAGNQIQRVYDNEPQSGSSSTGKYAYEDEAAEENESKELTQEKIEEDALGFDLYPNPTKGKFSIYVIGLDDVVINSVRVYDNSGRLLMNSEGVKKSNVSFNIASFAKGVYLANITLSNGNVLTKRIIKD